MHPHCATKASQVSRVGFSINDKSHARAIYKLSEALAITTVEAYKMLDSWDKSPNESWSQLAQRIIDFHRPGPVPPATPVSVTLGQTVKAFNEAQPICAHCDKPRKGIQLVRGGQLRGNGMHGNRVISGGQTETREQAGLCTCHQVSIYNAKGEIEDSQVFMTPEEAKDWLAEQWECQTRDLKLPMNFYTENGRLAQTIKIEPVKENQPNVNA